MQHTPGREDTSVPLTGRIVESFGRRVLVEIAPEERLPAELFGKRLSCVCGDEVTIRPAPAGTADAARVIAVAPRRSRFARTDSRGRTEVLAANLSLLAVVVAPEPASDPYITDRYLAGAALAGIRSILIVNKFDLDTATAPAFQTCIAEYRDAGYPVMLLSAARAQGIEPLQAALRGETAMLVGQSGVGKTTLTNLLAPQSMRSIRTLSPSTGEGRHTSVSTALFRLPGGGELIDSPGVRDYAPPMIEDAMVQVGWPEFLTLAPQCRFNDCLHLREPGCAVVAALATGQLSARRYDGYKRLLNIMRGLAPGYERRR
ncbi:ribosome biogenesis GTPase [Steroidobacter denitrificans]|uniref:Small ribosomal subunit biogenesis GTPase RsgA n=1 Tax=Steroidobacter denitrificans TaxID=465721 RepID=A0A127FCC3_STEDE|nr:ribosome small subunit-dependent GTPase A [Steroidobacter denitrificans]AMN47235.1 ribosome biogenesis GTPase [Steroidobacter denitrificans]